MSSQALRNILCYHGNSYVMTCSHGDLLPCKFERGWGGGMGVQFFSIPTLFDSYIELLLILSTTG